jgi:hypothetical protein
VAGLYAVLAAVAALAGLAPLHAYIGNDGLVHEERDLLTCACGLAAITGEELDSHLLKVFTSADRIGRDGKKHDAAQLPARA